MRDTLLLCMCTVYVAGAVLVLVNFRRSGSVSEILNNRRTTAVLLVAVMTTLTLSYEGCREDPFSMSTMVLLCVGMFGVVLVDESRRRLHRPCALLTLCSVVAFMFHHCRKSVVLVFLMYFPCLLLPATRASFVASECLLLFDFALFYLYLHAVETFSKGE